MSMETDGVEEVFEGHLRVLLTAAGQMGERLARAREEALRRAQADSEREAREVRSRYDAEHRVARAELGNVHRPGWWDQASADQIAATYAAARAWAHDDPEAVRAEQQLRQEVRARYGVDLDATGADPAAVREAVERAERARAQASTSQGVGSQGPAEQGEAALLLAQADASERHADRARARTTGTDADAETEAGAGRGTKYDSPTRREATAAALVGAGVDRETAATRMRADVSQAKPAAAATATAGATAAKARRTRETSLSPQRGAAQR